MVAQLERSEASLRSATSHPNRYSIFENALARLRRSHRSALIAVGSERLPIHFDAVTRAFRGQRVAFERWTRDPPLPTYVFANLATLTATKEEAT